MNLNKVIIGWRLTADPELRQTPGGTSVLRFTIATDRPRPKDGGEAVTDFNEFTAFDKRAELIARSFRKGSNIIVVGRLQTRNWETRTGEKRKSTEVSVDEVVFVDKYDPTVFAADDPSPTGKQYAPVTVPSTGKQVGMPIPPSYTPPAYGGSQEGFEEIPPEDSLPF